MANSKSLLGDAKGDRRVRHRGEKPQKKKRSKGIAEILRYENGLISHNFLPIFEHLRRRKAEKKEATWKKGGGRAPQKAEGKPEKKKKATLIPDFLLLEGSFPSMAPIAPDRSWEGRVRKGRNRT